MSVRSVEGTMFIDERRELLTGLFIALAAFLIYFNSLWNGFVADDSSVILNNPALKGPAQFLLYINDTTTPSQPLPFYRPFTYLSFLIEERIHGFMPMPMHFVNVSLHAVNAYLVFRLSKTFFNDLISPTLAGFLFAVHPLHSEAVNFIAGGRNTLLACLFSLLSYLIHRRSLLRGSYVLTIVAALLFMAGLFSKEIAIMTFLFIVALEIAHRSNEHSENRRTFCLRLLPYILATLCYLTFRWMTLSRLKLQSGFIPGSVTDMMQELHVVPNLVERITNNFFIIPKYLAMVLWPTTLSSRYALPDDFNVYALPLGVCWIAIISAVVIIISRIKSKASLFGLAWLICFWLPVSGVVFFSGIQLADRYLYVPAIGLWIIVADQSAVLFHSKPVLRRYLVTLTCIFLSLLCVITVRRNIDWKSNITLYKRLVEQYPDNSYGHASLGEAYLRRKFPGDSVLAEKEFETALSLNPDIQTVQSFLGDILLDRGDSEGALKYYSEALAMNPLNKTARVNRGIAYERLGQSREALADYKYFLRMPFDSSIPGAREYAQQRVGELDLKK